MSTRRAISKEKAKLAAKRTALPRGSTFSLRPPDDYLLTRDLCSYGYFLLEPNLWIPDAAEFVTTLDLGKRAVTVRITQPSPKARIKPGTPLRVRADAILTNAEKALLRERLTRMMRLDEHSHVIREFHTVDQRWRKTGRGRLMRSPTLFEDVIKTVTSCNVTWPSTVSMNRRLCHALGRKSASGLHAFPTARTLARTRPATLRSRCGVGYRDRRIVELAQLFNKSWPTESAHGANAAWLEHAATEDEAVTNALIDLPGIGPYAAANIMQLMGRYAHLPLDTESVRHGRTLLGYSGSSAQVMKHVKKHYEPFGAHKFRSYWFELWDYYEAKRGPAWTWERETTGKSFTAALLDR